MERSHFMWLLILAVGLTSSIRGNPANYPTNVKAGDVFYFGGNYIPGDVYSKNLDIVSEYVSEMTPTNGIELYVNYGEVSNEVWALSQCYSQSREECKDCLIAARVKIDDFNVNSPLRGGGLWTVGSRYTCFLLYNDQPLQINDTGKLITRTISPSAVASPSTPSSAVVTKTKLGWYVYMGAVIIVVGLAAIFVLACMLKKIPQHKSHLEKIEGSVETVTRFKYNELKNATRGFSQDNKLGQGGFGVVYKGVLKGGMEVAVKQLAMQSKQGNNEFINEISIITGVQHKNLVRLKGYCIEGDQRLLVYEFLHNRSLDLALFDPKVGVFLDWRTRYNIVLGISRGLAYLHQDSQVQIIHRDVKASNILLDKNLNPKISDFGISKLFAEDMDFTTTSVVGTCGYLAPEVIRDRLLTVKADVFGFGVLALEIVRGRKCSDLTMPAERQYLLSWAWDAYGQGKLLDLVDTRLDSLYSVDEVLKVINLALLCTLENPHHRPMMSNVVAMLLGYVDLDPLPLQRPSYPGIGKYIHIIIIIIS